MPKFLNRESTISEIIEIIKEAKAEIIMVVPYIKISPTIYSVMHEAEKDGKEILLIYREESIKQAEREKLFALSNLTVMNHPNVHAKCYLNEDNMVIGSMNLYERSKTENREMGILINTEDYTDRQAYNEAIEEVRSIVIASNLEKPSNRTEKNGFNYKILRPKSEIIQPIVDNINQTFIHKRFEVIDEGFEFPSIRCFPYYENISVNIDYDWIDDEQVDDITITFRRFALSLKHREDLLERIHGLFHQNLDKNNFSNINIYWDHYKKMLTLYPNKKNNPDWDTISLETSIQRMKPGLDTMIQYINSLEKQI